MADAPRKSFGRHRKPLASDMLDLQRRKDALKADKMPKPRGLYFADGNPAAAADKPEKPAATPAVKKPVAAVAVTPKKAKGVIGAASNKDLPGKTTITMAAGPKRDVAALRARSKASLADSKVAAAAHKNGPGGGASTVLASLRRERKPTSREK